MKARDRGLLAILIALSAGCGAASQAPADKSPVTSPSSAIEPAAAREQLAAAIKEVVDTRYVDFSFTMSLHGSDVLKVRGTHDAEAGWTATARLDGRAFGEDGTATLGVRAYRGKLWMQMREWKPPTNVCWLPMSSTQVPVGILAFRPLEPAYLTVLADFRTTGYSDDSRTDMVGTGSLDTISQLMTGQTLRALGVTSTEPLAKHRVPVRFLMNGGRLAGFSIKGNDIVSALDRIGYGDETVRQLYDGSRFAGSYELGVADSVSAPPRAAQVDVQPPADPSCPLSRTSPDG